MRSSSRAGGEEIIISFQQNELGVLCHIVTFSRAGCYSAQRSRSNSITALASSADGARARRGAATWSAPCGREGAVGDTRGPSALASAYCYYAWPTRWKAHRRPRI
eukprot:6187880-Pleurochrysis_carterae.AAC.3